MARIFTVSQLEAIGSSKAPKATLEEENKLAVKWANEVAELSDAHARITGKDEAAAATGYVIDRKRYYAARVGAKAHSLLDSVK